jgi:hypothetical protein
VSFVDKTTGFSVVVVKSLLIKYSYGSSKKEHVPALYKYFPNPCENFTDVNVSTSTSSIIAGFPFSSGNVTP